MGEDTATDDLEGGGGMEEEEDDRYDVDSLMDVEMCELGVARLAMVRT